MEFILSYIEKKRKNKQFFWKCCVFSKDFLWGLYDYCQNKIVIPINRYIGVRKFINKYKKVDKYYKISFCITSMDRLPHLQKTLIKNIENNISYPNIEFVLLDYNSKDGLEQWVKNNCQKYLEKNILKYHRVDWPTKFHMSNAKNISHQLATGEILCNLDADNFTNKSFAFFINFEFNKNYNIIGFSRGLYSGFGGRIFLSKNNFAKLAGYDENFIGWGFEDLDFKSRALDLGLSSVKIPNFFLECIKHENELREINMLIPIKDSAEINKKLYLEKREKAHKYYKF